MSIKKKLLVISTIILVLVIAFRIYRYEIFVWSCEQEQIASSCMLAGKIMQERGELVSAQRHFVEACNRDYGIACYHLAELYLRQGMKKDAAKFYLRACKLDYDAACTN